MVHNCTDPLVLLCHVNSSLEQTHRDNIAYCLACRVTISFGDALPKRIMNSTTNKVI